MKGEQHTVVVTSLANSGEGVGHIQDKVFFIPFSCPGDKLLVEITQSKKSYGRARIVKIIEAADTRITPHCEYFGSCGGCDWQHLPYKNQLYWKQENLKQTLKRIGGITDLSVMKEIKSSPSTFSYRNRIQLYKIGNQLHYSKKGSHSKIAITHCPIADTAINDFIKVSANWLHLKDGKYEFATSDKDSIEMYPVNEVGQSELGFRQVNTLQNKAIATRIIELVKEFTISDVIDLYCGQGNWGIELTNQDKTLTCHGIDSNEINITKAQEWAHSRLSFQLGDVSKVLPTLDVSGKLIIVDPPRAGLSPEFQRLIESSSVPYMIYISCDPATLARDLKTLSEKWLIKSIEPFDMFPQTSHLECLTLLQSDSCSKTAKC